MRAVYGLATVAVGIVVLVYMVLLQRDETLDQVNRECFESNHPIPNAPEFLNHGILCIIIKFFQALVESTPSCLYLLNLLMWFTPVVLMAYIEASRPVLSNTILGYPVVIFLFAQAITGALAFSFIYFPLYFYYRSKTAPRLRDFSFNFEPFRFQLALLIAVGFGFLGCTLALFTFEPNSYSQSIAIAVWQICPVFTSLLYNITASVLSSNVGEKRRAAPAHAEFCYKASSNLYKLSFVLNAIVYLSTIAYVAYLYSVGKMNFSLYDLFPLDLQLSRPVSDSLSQAATKLLVYDGIGFYVSAVLWAVLDGQLKIGMGFLVIFLVLGPGAALSYLFVRREKSRFQLSKKND